MPRPHSVQHVLDLARSHGLDLDTTHDELDQTGLDFFVLHAHDPRGVAWILRTPRRAEVYASTVGEKRVLDLVRPHLKPAVPDFVVHSEQLIAYPRLEGTPAMELYPAPPSSTTLGSFAETIVALQNVPEPAAAGTPVRSIEAERVAHREAMLGTRAELQPPEALWARWQRWLDDDTLWPTRLALVHGDLHPGHLLLGPTGVIWGILDWTEAAVTDPSIDLAMFYGCYGAEAFDVVLEHIETAGGLFWPSLRAHAIERWAAFPALAAAWAVRTGNATALDFARAQVAKSV